MLILGELLIQFICFIWVDIRSWPNAKPPYSCGNKRLRRAQKNTRQTQHEQTNVSELFLVMLFIEPISYEPCHFVPQVDWYNGLVVIVYKYIRSRYRWWASQKWSSEIREKKTSLVGAFHSLYVSKASPLFNAQRPNALHWDLRSIQPSVHGDDSRIFIFTHPQPKKMKDRSVSTKRRTEEPRSYMR